MRKAGWALLCMALCAQGAALRIEPEYLRTGPDGGIVEPDRAAAGHARPTVWTGARAGYVSFQVVASLKAAGEYTLDWTIPAGLEVDVFREWYHALERAGGYFPDALVPVRSP